LAVEAAGMVENCDQVAEVGGAARRVELAVLVDELLKGVEELQAPPCGGRPGDRWPATST
jgi:hypothetical protein